MPKRATLSHGIGFLFVMKTLQYSTDHFGDILDGKIILKRVQRKWVTK
jgi:hypothetical protein